MKSKNILFYGDSITRGRIPWTKKRFGLWERWTSIVSIILGNEYTCIEEWLRWRCLGESSSIWRSWLPYFYSCILSHFPLDVLVLFLWTNDLAIEKRNIAEYVNSYFKKYANTIQSASEEFSMNMPEVILISPPYINSSLTWNSSFSQESEQNSLLLSSIYADIAINYGWHFFDAGWVVWMGHEDGIHLDKDQNLQLWNALGDFIIEILQ